MVATTTTTRTGTTTSYQPVRVALNEQWLLETGIAITGKLGSGAWLTGQVSRPDPWRVLPAPVRELAGSEHSTEGLRTIPAPEGGLREGQKFGALVPRNRVEVGQHLVQQGASGRGYAPPRPFIAVTFPLLPEFLAGHPTALAVQSVETKSHVLGAAQPGIRRHF